MRKFAGFVSFSLIMLVSFQACEHVPMSDINGVNSVCFERDILPIFNSKCAMSGCHDAATRAEGYQLTNYKNIVSHGIVKGNAGKSEIYEEIEDGDMPPQGYPTLSSTEMDLLKRWINEGAKNGTNCPSTGCDSSQFTFSGQIQPLMNKYCNGCHNSTNASMNVNVSNYAGVTVAVAQGLLRSIDHSGYYPMPKGGSKLSNCEIVQVQKWIQAGMPNN